MSHSSTIRVQDLISTGIYTAIYFIVVAISALLVVFLLPGYSYVFIPIISGFLAGPIFMLLAAKVPRFGAISIMGSIMGIFFFLSGRFPYAIFISVGFALLADGVGYLIKYRGKWGLLLAYILFSFNPSGPVVPMLFAPQRYIDYLNEYGRDVEYIQGAFADITQNTIWVLIFGIIFAAILGGLFGQRLMGKHFKKAGMI